MEIRITLTSIRGNTMTLVVEGQQPDEVLSVSTELAKLLAMNPPEKKEETK